MVRKQDRKALKEPWRFPLSPAAYDTRSELDECERAALSVWMGEHRKLSPGVFPQLKAVIHRICRPIDDALEVMQIPRERARLEVFRVLLQEINSHQKVFWAWSTEDWLKMIKGTPQDFIQRYGVCNCRQAIMGIAYLLCDFQITRKENLEQLRFDTYSLAVKVFGSVAVEAAIQPVYQGLKDLGYGDNGDNIRNYRPAICDVLLANRSPRLEDLTTETLERLRLGAVRETTKVKMVGLSLALEKRGIIRQPLQQLRPQNKGKGSHGAWKGIAPAWVDWCNRWQATSTGNPGTCSIQYYELLTAGRWLAQNYPEVTQPDQWTRQLALEYVAAINRMKVGDYSKPRRDSIIGREFAPSTKSEHLQAMRRFFLDCQEWEWIPIRFNPNAALATPRAITRLIGPQERQIDSLIWAKLMSAGLNLTEADLSNEAQPKKTNCLYPIQMIRTLALIWLFCGLRNDEIIRLRVGCIRWTQPTSTMLGLDELDALDPDAEVCVLDIPTGKNGSAFSKVVDPLVGQAILAWEQSRPEQPRRQDRKTGETVHHLFSFRGKQIGKSHINDVLIPRLCHKAGVPVEDAKGAITSHRARHTILSQLAESMTFAELQSWSGHKDAESLLFYLNRSPMKQAAAYLKTDYFKNNQRTLDVLLDEEVITSGTAATGQPWKFYDLGDGFCGYDHFSQCPHRMVCPHCAFFTAKDSAEGQLLSSKPALLKMRQEIPFTEEEQALHQEGAPSLVSLCDQLADVPTPEGPTPKQIASNALQTSKQA